MSDVIDFPGMTRNPIPVDKVLTGEALNACTDVLCLGWKEDGSLLIACSETSYRENIYMLELAKHQLLTNLLNRG